jgi:hypothetical protein
MASNNRWAPSEEEGKATGSQKTVKGAKRFPWPWSKQKPQHEDNARKGEAKDLNKNPGSLWLAGYMKLTSDMPDLVDKYE